MNSSGTPADGTYGPAVIHGALFVGAFIAERERDERRARRMRVALSDQVAAYRKAFPEAEELPEDVSPDVLELVPADWPQALASTYLIDVLFTRPFSPAELKFKIDDRDDALGAVCQRIGLTTADLDRARNLARSAERAHRGKLDIGKIALVGGGAMVVIAATAGAAVPFIASAVGGAAGLGGAAALAHGMAVLGFGSLAAGGLGMAGGMWIVTGAGALVGGAGGSAAAALIRLGPSAARTELIKLQTTAAAVTLRHSRKSEVARFVGTLLSERDDVRATRAEMLRRNEDDAEAIKRLDDIEDAFGDAIRWMNERIEAS